MSHISKIVQKYRAQEKRNKAKEKGRSNESDLILRQMEERKVNRKNFALNAAAIQDHLMQGLSKQFIPSTHTSSMLRSSENSSLRETGSVREGRGNITNLRESNEKALNERRSAFCSNVNASHGLNPRIESHPIIPRNVANRIQRVAPQIQKKTKNSGVLSEAGRSVLAKIEQEEQSTQFKATSGIENKRIKYIQNLSLGIIV
jgi:hypothetical protein